eukprot:jgi/Psemu1/32823/gm1.32823_g
MDMLKNLEKEESLDKMAASGITHHQKLTDLEDYFKIDDVLKSIEGMDDPKKKVNKINDSTDEDIMEYQQQLEKHDEARNGDCSVSAKASAYTYTIPHSTTMYHKWLKEKAVAGDKSIKEMAKEYMDTKPRANYLSEMTDGESKRMLERKLDQILNLKWCSNETGEDNDQLSISNVDDDKDKDKGKDKNNKGIGANEEVGDKTGDENNAVSSASRNKCDNDDNNNDKGIGVETSGSAKKNKPKDNTNEVVGDKTGDENGDENNLLFNTNGDGSYDDNNDKDNDMDNTGMEGGKHHADGIKRQALMTLVEKKGKEELIEKRIKLDDQTPEHTLQEITAIEDMTVEQLLYAKNVLKDDNREKLPTEKLQRPGIKKPNYKDVSSDENSNGKKESDNEKESENEVDEEAEEEKNKIDEEAVAMVAALQEDATDKNKEEEKKNKVDEEAFAMVAALQEDVTSKNKEEEEKNEVDEEAGAMVAALQEEVIVKNKEEEEKNKAIERKETEQNKTAWKDYFPSLSSWWSKSMVNVRTKVE